MINSFNDTYKDNSLITDNIITKTIKLDSTNSISNNNSSNNCVDDESNNPNNTNNPNNNENIMFWIDDPKELFSKTHITELWPLDEMSREQN